MIFSGMLLIIYLTQIPLRSLILCNDREIMQHLSSYGEVLVIKGLPEPSTHLQTARANHLLSTQPCFLCSIPNN